jgi:nucleotide-binding universal stress UspA family protein
VAEKPNEENHAREGLLEATQAYSGKFPSLKTRFRAGSAAERILEEVESQEYGLLVAGFRGRHGPARSMGSTTERLVRLSRVPLLIVPEIRPSLQKILLCMATGATGRSDVLFAGRLAGVSGARTTLLHILGGNGDAPGGSGEHSRTREYILQLTSDWLARGARTLQLMGVPAELKVRDGSVVEGILEEARDGDYDLIALGAPAPPRAAGTWRREIVDAVLERAKRPVLIIPAAPNTEQ